MTREWRRPHSRVGDARRDMIDGPEPGALTQFGVRRNRGGHTNRCSSERSNERDSSLCWPDRCCSASPDWLSACRAEPARPTTSRWLGTTRTRPVKMPRPSRGPSPKRTAVRAPSPKPGRPGPGDVADRESGRSSEGYTCNMEMVGVYGPDDPQGFEGAEWQFARYKDSAGHQCGYYSQRMFGYGVVVPRVQDPMSPRRHPEAPGHGRGRHHGPRRPEVRQEHLHPGHVRPLGDPQGPPGPRGLLAAANVMDGQAYGFMGIYDLKEDCRNPKKLFDGPVTAVYNHEGNISYDGMTYYTGAPPGRREHRLRHRRLRPDQPEAARPPGTPRAHSTASAPPWTASA